VHSRLHTHVQSLHAQAAGSPTRVRHTVASPPLPSPSRSPPLPPPQMPRPRSAALATAAAAATAAARRPPPAGDSNKAAPRGCTSETRPLRKDASETLVEDHGEVREGGQPEQLGRDGGGGVHMRSPSRRGPAQLVSCCVHTSARSAAHHPRRQAALAGSPAKRCVTRDVGDTDSLATTTRAPQPRHARNAIGRWKAAAALVAPAAARGVQRASSKGIAITLDIDFRSQTSREKKDVGHGGVEFPSRRAPSPWRGSGAGSPGPGEPAGKGKARRHGLRHRCRVRCAGSRLECQSAQNSGSWSWHGGRLDGGGARVQRACEVGCAITRAHTTNS
jgi:hypothetical protein